MSYENDLRFAVIDGSNLKSLALNARELVIKDTAGVTLSTLEIVEGMIYQVLYLDASDNVKHTIIRSYSYLKMLLNSNVCLEIENDLKAITPESGYIDANDGEEYINENTEQVYIASDLDAEDDVDKYHIAKVDEPTVWYPCVYDSMIVSEGQVSAGAYIKDDVTITLAIL